MGSFKDGMSGVTEDTMNLNESNLVPEGDYNVQCERMELKQNQNTGTKSVSMRLKILGPKHAGRIVFQNFYCFSDNESHNNRMYNEMGIFAKRAGYPANEVSTMDLGDFEGLKAGARIKVKKSEQYGDKNEVAHFKKPINEIEAAEASSVAINGEARNDELTPF